MKTQQRLGFAMIMVFYSFQVLSAADIVDFRDNRADAFATSFTETLQNRIVIINTQKAPTDDINMRKVRRNGLPPSKL